MRPGVTERVSRIIAFSLSLLHATFFLSLVAFLLVMLPCLAWLPVYVYSLPNPT